MIFHTKSSIETISLGEKIGSLLKPGDILAMTGTLAAGSGSSSTVLIPSGFVSTVKLIGIEIIEDKTSTFAIAL